MVLALEGRRGAEISLSFGDRAAVGSKKVSPISDLDLFAEGVRGARPTKRWLRAIPSSATYRRCQRGRVNADKWLATNNPTPMTAGTTDNWSEVAKWHWDEGDRQGTGLGHIDLMSNR